MHFVQARIGQTLRRYCFGVRDLGISAILPLASAVVDISDVVLHLSRICQTSLQSLSLSSCLKPQHRRSRSRADRA
jgi:hypothetical protein|tara:strand:- start:17361 stop:17588 length:228 start_codon:yes stop_codon:yes gene_type:complete